MVEALVAITLLAIGSFATAQTFALGLRTSGMSRQRLAARSAADQQMEFARSLNYDSLVLDDTSPLAQSSDPNSPDHWIDQANQTWYNPDGPGPTTPEGLIRVPGASPALHHFQSPVWDGSTKFTVYMYVTWVDSPTDGLGGADVNTNGNDANGHDLKRVTVVVTWADALGGGVSNLTQSSLFSDGNISYHQPALNHPPTVACPTAVPDSGNPLKINFTAQASDTDGSIASVSWNFGDNSALGSGLTVSHTYASGGTYSIVNSVIDNGGGTATNTALNCTVSVVDPSAGNGGPNGTVKILNDVTYTNNTNVTLNLGCTSSCPPSSMQFSNDGSTWSAKQPYSTSSIWTLTSGDGSKTVYARFWNSTTLFGATVSDTITLDTTPPGAPTGLTSSSTAQGANKTVTLSWTAPSPLPSDFAGYRVWQRLTTGSIWTQVSCSSGTTCSEMVKKTDNYEFYVEAYDKAGNTSAQSNHLTA